MAITDSNPSAHSGLRDNHSRGKAGDFLKGNITPGSVLSFVSAYFTVHAYQALRDELEGASKLRFLFGEPSFIRSIEKDGKQSRQFQLGDQGLSVANQLSQKKVAKDCADWISRMVEIKSIVRAGFLHGKMYHIQDGKVAQALLGSSNFTVPGLGLQASGNNIELNLVVSDDRDRDDLLKWFNGLWDKDDLTTDVRDQVLKELARLYSSAYDLVVIDESHNFRNNKQATQRPDEPVKRSRYQRLMEEVVRKGQKTKVLLLSATPVNNQLADLRNQISFIAGGDVARDAESDAAFSRNLEIPSVKETTRIAQGHFTTWSRRPPERRTTRDLLQSIGGDFFKLLDGLSIARSRKQISTYYKDEMKRLGGFPNRPPPIAVHTPIDLKDGFLSFEQLDKEITDLRLALYHPTSFLRDDLPQDVKSAYEDKILGSFTQQGREKILIAMMKVNFLKRLESSVDSFRLTLHRTIGKINTLEGRIAKFEIHAENHPEIDWDNLTPDEIEDPDEETKDFTIGGRRRIHLAHLKLEEWLQAVRHDRTQPKETLLLLRGLAAGHPTAFEKLCDLFDSRTQGGADMNHYDGLAHSALRSVESTFQKRAAASLLTSRDGLLPTMAETPKADAGDWELVTWLVVLDSKT